MTVRELLNKGYSEGDTAYQRGYVSRRNFEPGNQEVYQAGGSRKGQYYYLAPCYHSTKYCVRCYLFK